MSLTPGTRLGPYEVQAAIGAGGMGEVYRAHDTKLDRDVALKILPESFAADPDRLMRFEREAKTLASLNHPNIAQVYAIEGVVPPSGGEELRPLRQAIVLELVEGEDLAARIRRGPVPLDEALAIARQVADALEAAHEQGIVHRDLKPANIKVRPDGAVKVLDFGLAKAMDPGGGPGSGVGDPSQSPTMTSPAMTAMGMILGTAAYMSPEQARGRSVDRRADVWAFGCVLYEMLTGRPAFQDEDVSLTLSKVLQRDPDFEAFPADVPDHVRRVVRLCLEKRLRDRVTDVATVRLALEGAFATAPVQAAAAAPTPRSGRPLLIMAVAAVVAGAAIGRYALAPDVPPVQPFEFDVLVPGKAIESGSFALSPDGSRLALAIRDESGVRHLAVRDMDQTEVRVLPGTEGATYPFWSPDGREIGYFSGQQLSRIAIDGAAPRPVATVADPRGGAWTDGDVMLIGSASGPIQKVPASGGRPEPLTQLAQDVEQDGHVWPALLPDRQRFVFLADGPTDEAHRVYLGRVDGGPTEILKTVIRSQPVVDPSGRLLLGERGQLVAYPFDLETGALGVDSTLVATGVYPLGSQHELPASAGTPGMIAFQHTSADSRLVFVDHAGRPMSEVSETGRYANVRIAPGGTQLAFEVFSDSEERLIWVEDLERGVRTPASFREKMADSVAWSPDGRTVYFDSNANGTWEAYRKTVTGGGEPERLGLPDGASEVVVLDVSSDGRWLLGAPQFSATRYDLSLYALDGAGGWTPWLDSPAQEEYGVFSPDARWIAYTSDASGRVEVYLAPLEGGPSVERLQISSGGGFEPRFSRDGRTLYYRSATFDVMAVDVQLAGGSVHAGTPRELFTIAPIELPYRRNLMDVLPDGSGFITLEPATGDQLSVRIRTGR